MVLQDKMEDNEAVWWEIGWITVIFNVKLPSMAKQNYFILYERCLISHMSMKAA